MITWHGEQVQAQVMARVDQELAKMGRFLVHHMEQYVAVDTGALRASFYDQVDTATHTLTVTIPLGYGIYQEFGTRFIPPHPYIRPSLIDTTAVWNFSDITITLFPVAQRSEPLRATTSGFGLPRKQQLTPAQVEHVNKKLRPVSRSLAGKFKRRGVSFKVAQGGRREF